MKLGYIGLGKMGLMHASIFKMLMIRNVILKNPKGRVPRACAWVNVCDGDMR